MAISRVYILQKSRENLVKLARSIPTPGLLPPLIFGHFIVGTIYELSLQHLGIMGVIEADLV